MDNDKNTKSETLSTERVVSGRAIRSGRGSSEELVSFENRNKQRHYWVEMDCPEFTCLCPVSGFPDFATIHIKYIPKDRCVELKSLKLYINSFRDEGVYHEDVSNRILDDLIQLLDPWKIEVVGDFNVRGNIKTIIRAEHTHPEFKPQ